MRSLTSPNPPVRTDLMEFVANNPVFRHEEFVEAYLDAGHTTIAAKRALAHAVSRRRIERLRRGLYICADADIDYFDLAAKIMPPTAVLSHVSALAFHGLTEIENSLVISSPMPAPAFHYDDVEFRYVQHALPQEKALDRTTTYPRFGAKVAVANLGRAFVDCLHRPRFGPGTLADLFELVAHDADLPIDLPEAADQVLALGCSTTAARFAAFLWAHPKWRFDSACRGRTACLLPRHTVYAEPDRPAEGKRLGNFRLMISPELSDAFARAR